MPPDSPKTCVETDAGGNRCSQSDPYHINNHRNEHGEWPGTDSFCGSGEYESGKYCWRDKGHSGEHRDMYWDSPKVSKGRYVADEPDWKIAGFDDEAAYERYKRWLGNDKI